MLNTLVRSFYFSFEEDQEKAICKLLSSGIKTWRKFEEVLACMNTTGQRISSEKILFENIDRINATLDGHQQLQFNYWVASLAERNTTAMNNIKPYTPYKNLASKKNTIKNQISYLNKHYNARFIV